MFMSRTLTRVESQSVRQIHVLVPAVHDAPPLEVAIGRGGVILHDPGDAQSHAMAIGADWFPQKICEPAITRHSSHQSGVGQ